jgi:radical SAM protein with 4Fe4S-binding SPASM domain
MNALDVPPRLVEARLAGQRDELHLLLHPHAPRWIVLNAVGLAVARLCDGTRTAGEIAAVIAAQWAQPVARVAADVGACVARLAEAGFLDGGAFDRAMPEEPDGAAGHPPRQAWRLHLHLTESCNLRCQHCGVVAAATANDGAAAVAAQPPALAGLRASQPRTANARVAPAHLDSALIRGLIDQAVAAGAEGVAFGGGEPFLHADLGALLAYAAPRLKTLLATNAALLDDAAAETLARLGVIVQVSLDGPDAALHDRIRGEGAFAEAWRGIERLQQAGLGERLALNVTLMRPNIGLLSEIVALAERRGIAGVRFTALQRMGRAAAQWAVLAPTADEYAQAYRFLYRCRPAAGLTLSPGLLGLELEPPDRGLWCGLGRTLLVDARGDIYPCGLLSGPEFRLGNVRDTRLADALASEKLAQLIARCAERRETIPECRACAWQHFCQAGCAGSVWQLHGALDATDGLCAVRRELYSELTFDRAASPLCNSL